MTIEHVALWTPDLERSKEFYQRFFGCRSSGKYLNPEKEFSSYFLEFGTGARLELMSRPGLCGTPGMPSFGLAHFAVSVGSEGRVRELTRELELAGVTVAGQPRRTGDGYYEAVILDPDGNRIEITV